ncbi:MAG: hypothetical protein WD042_12605 [Phycisphaeraceae bacterium]
MAKRSLTFRLLRAMVIVLAISIAALPAYMLWQPGQVVTDGRHDRGTNGIWLSHAWLGDGTKKMDQAKSGIADSYELGSSFVSSC